MLRPDSSSVENDLEQIDRVLLDWLTYAQLFSYLPTLPVISSGKCYWIEDEYKSVYDTELPSKFVYLWSEIENQTTAKSESNHQFHNYNCNIKVLLKKNERLILNRKKA